MSDGHDIHCSIRYVDLQVVMVAESISWAPDAAADLMTRVVAGFREAVAIVADYETEDAEADDEQPDGL